MTQEEKAKAYDKAIEKIKYVMEHGVSPVLNKEDLQDIFPELAESEDEKIRQKFIKLVKMSSEVGGFALHKWEADEMLAWLEKQGEQKSVDKVEPKFNVGDWIVFNGLTLYVKEVVKGFYRTITIDGISNSYDWDIDNIARLWTIADANDGDVLSCDSKYGQEIGLVKKYIGKYGGCDKCFETYCFVDWDGIFRVGEYMGSQNIHPATKEQRDTLFAKIKEAGMSGMLRRKNY